MKFVRLTLVNIRSYTKQQIVFPDGIVLLAGDIGAGKSTILLAIEFALFGILRGSLSPSVLLRYGCQTGLVELAFSVQDKEYIVRRVLKRTQETIEQESGCLIFDGMKKEGTATELKAWILDVLGYPLELINKTKSLVYRYTVYTPQEDMKRILFDGAESRLGVLRKVFDIDKYKRISENAQTYARALRERCRLIEGKISDLGVKCARFEAQEKEIGALQASILSAQSALQNVQNECDAKQQEVRKHEVAALALREKRHELDIQKNTLVMCARIAEEYCKDDKKLQEQISVLESELAVPLPKSIDDFEQLSAESGVIEQKYSAVNQEIAKLGSIKEQILMHSSEVNDKAGICQKLQCQIALIEAELSTQKASTFDDFEVLKKNIVDVEQKYYCTLQEIAKLNALLDEHLSVQQKVSALELCPLCRQNVSHEHKKNIVAQKQALADEIKSKIIVFSSQKKVFEENIHCYKLREEEIIEFQKQQHALLEKARILEEKRADKQLVEDKIREHTVVLKSLDESFKKLPQFVNEKYMLEQRRQENRIKLEKLLEIQKQQQAVALNEKLLQEKRVQKQNVDKQLQGCNAQLVQLKDSCAEIEKHIASQASVDKVYELAKSSFVEVQERLNWHKLALGSLAAKQDVLSAQQAELAREIAEKKSENAKKELLDKKQEWLSGYFTSLMDMMERAVFAKVWAEFNSYFVQWFGMLIEDESITARLDDACSPVIEQNGYEASIENLSGGEKTACALAYRLALNKVINDVMVSMRTKDVLILDEPTDGFSAEQIDRLKDVLDALHAKQVIIVSHEKKIEGFADNIIRVEKNSHVSCIVV
ncbi:MAG: SMC family ATPase [Candidatus Aenigmarchaeota archaeon]|nr:SMC family ATPase [Candidatus Aenigmarchaeota archaeon]